jgi:hypothetical protein
VTASDGEDENSEEVSDDERAGGSGYEADEEDETAEAESDGESDGILTPSGSSDDDDDDEEDGLPVPWFWGCFPM